MKNILLLLVASVTLSNASITISGGAVSNFADENNIDLTAATTFAVLVALNDDPFDGLVMSDTISVGQTVGDGKYFVLQVGTTIDQSGGGFGQVAQVNVSSFNLTGTPLAGNAASGNHVAMLWFPDLVGSTVSANDVYGAIRAVDWVLPADGGSLSYSSLVSPGGSKPALFTVQDVVPEPTSIALLSLGAFGLILRRRRG